MLCIRFLNKQVNHSTNAPKHCAAVVYSILVIQEIMLIAVIFLFNLFLKLHFKLITKYFLISDAFFSPLHLGVFS
ncbi:hypothetical protein NIES4074_55210 [Cylindrospermum sp. NIES-4074]|nr:hypothetical protein NIES4074_55210 [Cylindrospermum sp. NIES-4074]